MYTSVGAFGVAKAALQCAGGELQETGTGETGGCCPPGTWTNQTYQTVKGRTSWQYYNEARVRHALNLLLKPSGPYKTGLEAFATANAAPDPLGLRMSLMRAQSNFDVTFPLSRWYVNPNWIAANQCGPYDVFTTKHVPPTPARLSLLSKLSGQTVTAAMLKTRYEKLVPRIPAPKNAYQRWVTKALIDVINKVPGSVFNGNVRAMPANAGKLVTVQGGKVVAGPWLRAFLGTFETPFGFKVSTFKPIERLPTITLPPLTIPGDPDILPDAKKPVPWMWIGLGVLVLGGGAYVLSRRR